MNHLRLEIIPSIDLHPTLKKDIKDWLISEFIDDEDETIWSNVDWHILGWLDNKLISHIDILERIVIVGGDKIPIAGIGGVVTKLEWRGRGIASRLMREANRFMAHEMAIEFGLLMCDQKRVSFYQELGWELVENTLVYDQPSGEEIFGDQVMIYPIKGRKFPVGKIDVRGYPW